MDRTGLSRHGEDDDGVRWVAVRHAGDHIHIVAVLARQDRVKPSVHNDRYRVRDACLAAEQRYGLRPTAPADRTAPLAGPGRERESGPPRPARAGPGHAAAARGHRRRLGQQRGGVLRRAGGGRGAGPHPVQHPQPRPGDRVRGRAARGCRPGRRPGVVRRREAGSRPDLAPAAAAVGRAVRPRAGHGRRPEAAMGIRGPARDQAAAHIRAVTRTDPAAAADAAWAASDTLHVAADALGSPLLRQAADAFDRAARATWGRIPAPTPAGCQLRQAARLIAASAHRTPDPAATWLVLIVRLAALAEAVAELRAVQQRAAQGAAARTAARRLHTAADPAPDRRPYASTAARLAALSFPGPPAPGPHPDGPPPGRADRDPHRGPRRPGLPARAGDPLMASADYAP
jgi:hypothetical protein